MSGQATHKQEAPKEPVLRHQPGQEAVKTILSEDIDWKPFAAFPPEARLAVLDGHPSERGPYTVRVKVHHGVKLMPHRHTEDRIYTVISGVFYIGLGDQFSADKLLALPPGAVIILPGNTSHFHWAKSGEYITQVTAIGPLALEYVNSSNRPLAGQEPKVTRVLSKDLTDIPGKEGLMLTVEYPPGGSTPVHRHNVIQQAFAFEDLQDAVRQTDLSKHG